MRDQFGGFCSCMHQDQGCLRLQFHEPLDQDRGSSAPCRGRSATFCSSVRSRRINTSSSSSMIKMFIGVLLQCRSQGDKRHELSTGRNPAHRDSHRKSPARLLVLCGDCPRLLLSHLGLCLQPIACFVSIASPALLVQFVGASTDLFLQLTSRFRCLVGCP